MIIIPIETNYITIFFKSKSLQSQNGGIYVHVEIQRQCMDYCLILLTVINVQHQWKDNFVVALSITWNKKMQVCNIHSFPTFRQDVQD